MPIAFYLLLSTTAVAVLAIVFVYARWEDRVDRRKSDRLIHRRLQEMSGR